SCSANLFFISYGHSFFFQAEDGIRYFHVTGVQTCALPICAKFFKSQKGEHFGTLNAHDDLYNNDAFFYGAQSINYNWVSECRYKKNNRVNLSVGAGALDLAAVPARYLRYAASRNYTHAEVARAP